MADTVTSQKLIDGQKWVVYQFTNKSDGTGENGVVKIDVSSLSTGADGQPCTGLKITEIQFGSTGMDVQVLWDANTPTTAIILQENGPATFDFTNVGGLYSNAGAGATGDIKFTTLNATAGDDYAITMRCRKTYD